MTKTRFGFLAAIAGAALSVWWWRARSVHRLALDEKRTVIFDATLYANSANGVL